MYIVERLAENFNISTKEALKKFIATDTYDLLLDNESFLYLESREYILSMLNDELEGNIQRWLEI